MRIEPASDLDEVRTIFREYADATGVDLTFQSFEQELATLESFYVTILVARDDCHPERSEGPSHVRKGSSFDTIAGCVALRHLDDTTCEMKRLYVRPAYRGRNLGRTLAMHVIDDARARGYKAMRLDTLPSMHAAMAMYASLGFREIEPYRFNPVAGSRFLELTL